MPRAKVNKNIAYLEVGFEAHRVLPASEVELFLRSLLQQKIGGRS
jgi:hypothetical protein